VAVVLGEFLVAPATWQVEVSARLPDEGAPGMKLLRVLIRVSQGLASRARNIWFRALGVRMPGYVWMRRVSIPRNWSSVSIEPNVSLDEGVVLLVVSDSPGIKIAVGAGTYVNRMSMFDASERIEVGRNCMIGPHCYITDHDHGYAAGGEIGTQPLVSAPVRIGDNVWIGAGAIVLKGVTIGENALIAAGAVVTRAVPARTKGAGVPAAEIGTSV
jgi:acetyltransferase-like isoleucine patch superfamily enzyme